MLERWRWSMAQFHVRKNCSIKHVNIMLFYVASLLSVFGFNIITGQEAAVQILWHPDLSVLVAGKVRVCNGYTCVYCAEQYLGGSLYLSYCTLYCSRVCPPVLYIHSCTDVHTHVHVQRMLTEICPHCGTSEVVRVVLLFC